MAGEHEEKLVLSCLHQISLFAQGDAISSRIIIFVTLCVLCPSHLPLAFGESLGEEATASEIPLTSPQDQLTVVESDAQKHWEAVEIVFRRCDENLRLVPYSPDQVKVDWMGDSPYTVGRWPTLGEAHTGLRMGVGSEQIPEALVLGETYSVSEVGIENPPKVYFTVPEEVSPGTPTRIELLLRWDAVDGPLVVGDSAPDKERLTHLRRGLHADAPYTPTGDHLQPVDAGRALHATEYIEIIARRLLPGRRLEPFILGSPGITLVPNQKEMNRFSVNGELFTGVRVPVLPADSTYKVFFLYESVSYELQTADRHGLSKNPQFTVPEALDAEHRRLVFLYVDDHEKEEGATGRSIGRNRGE